ncbi:hypothetical protein [Streptomyces sp. NPDC029721]|uniref:hypothetical protein n=1 Tax=Streptomyces sp. NPDC029721 TaxID=3157090 RepID=UPI00340D3EA4
MYENTQERPRTPASGITDGVVELRKRRPSAPAGAPGRPARSKSGAAPATPGRGPDPNTDPAPDT